MNGFIRKNYFGMLVFFAATFFVISGGNKVVAQSAVSYNRQLRFSGYQWVVKESTERVGPGDNIFSGSKRNVNVNCFGYLNIGLSRTGNDITCSEIVSVDSFSFGTYTFELAKNSFDFHNSLVLGLFLYNHAVAPLYNEVDIEFSKWNVPVNVNTQYIVYDSEVRPSKARFNTFSVDYGTKHEIVIRKDSILFRSYYIKPKMNGGKNLYASSTFLNPWDHKKPYVFVRFNLWLKDINTTMNGKLPELQVKNFSYSPMR